MAKTPRTWTGARTPSGLKRVRQAERRREVLQPRRSAAKTYVAKALRRRGRPPSRPIDPTAALAEALSALDRAAKAGAIHPNAAARRKSRLTRKVNAALGGAHVQTGGRVAKTTGKAAAAKAAKARIAAGKADKAKGAQTAAGKARAALSKTARAEAAAAKAAAEAGRGRRRGQRRPRPPPKAGRPRPRREAPRRPPRRRPRRPSGCRRPRAKADRQGRRRSAEEGHRRRGHRRAIRAETRRTNDAPVTDRGVSRFAAACRPQVGRAASPVAAPGLASVGFGRNAPYSPPPTQAPADASVTSTMPARPELLAPVEAGERVGIGRRPAAASSGPRPSSR